MTMVMVVVVVVVVEVEVVVATASKPPPPTRCAYNRNAFIDFSSSVAEWMAEEHEQQAVEAHVTRHLPWYLFNVP
jgi:hypothetical protein